MSKTIYESTVILTNTSNGKAAEAEIDNFKEGKGFDAFLATNKIPMRWNGKTYVGNQFGMEFTSNGPKYYETKQGRSF